MGSTLCNESKDTSKNENSKKVPKIEKKKNKGPDMTALHNDYQPAFE